MYNPNPSVQIKFIIKCKPFISNEYTFILLNDNISCSIKINKYCYSYIIYNINIGDMTTNRVSDQQGSKPNNRFGP